jgi:AMP deaminase
MGGQYLADITKELIQDLDRNKYNLVEWRLSIYGKSADEWSKLSQWFYQHRLAHPNVRWLIQVCS